MDDETPREDLAFEALDRCAVTPEAFLLCPDVVRTRFGEGGSVARDEKRGRVRCLSSSIGGTDLETQPLRLPRASSAAVEAFPGPLDCCAAC